MPSLNNVRASNAAYSPSYIPTIVVVGGTSGLGRAMVEIFAAQTKGRANIIILGRNKAAADEILASLPPPPSPPETNGVIIKHEFISCDASLMKNIHIASKEITSKVDKINYLVCSSGILTMGRTETEEGNDTSIALRYYGRVKFFRELLPLVKKAKEAGEDAKMMTIQAAAQGAAIDLKDLDLKNYSLMKSVGYVSTCNDILVKVRLHSLIRI
jgi:NAD(P)-dependent dehydrogenase (short-subunit alcohol dehydrogenase family)